MEISVPVFVTQQRSDGTNQVTAEALFHRSFSARDQELGRAISKLSNLLRDHLSSLARGEDHSQLMAWHCDENFLHKTISMRLDLHDATAKIKLPLIIQKLADRSIVFSPLQASLWFDWLHDERLESRATDFYQSHFRRVRKQYPDFRVEDRCSLKGKSWIDWLHLEIAVGGKVKKRVDPIQAFLGGDDVSDGAVELRKVGRCLNHLDVDDLAKPVGVDRSLAQLRTLLAVGDRRGIVLVGPPGSGKTARIEGVVRAMQSKKLRRLTWHLSPARIISGMSYLGQWQQRVLAILKHAHQRDHILYFDDLLGLLEAGKTRDSAMCVADMMRTQLETHPVRILAEMTNEAWAIFRRRDPKLASRLVVMPVAAMDAQQSTELMFRVRQQVEARYRCVFKFEMIPEWVSLYDRYDSASALPGKAISAMKSLAAKYPRQRITRNHLLSDFSTRTGLRRSVIDRNQSIPREELLRRIRQTVIGQDKAVDALLDRAMVAINRLNDRSRPLGTYLLVGPTESAKPSWPKPSPLACSKAMG